MEQRTINNLIDKLILEELKTYTSFDAQRIVEPLVDNLEDANEILDLIHKSKRYNSVYTSCGELVVFGTKLKNIEDAVWDLQRYVRDDDDCWSQWVDCDGESQKLGYYVDLDEV